MSPEPVAPSPEPVWKTAQEIIAAGLLDEHECGTDIALADLLPILTRLYLAAKIEALESVRGGPCSGEAKAIHSQCIAANLRDTLAKLREEAK